MGVHDTDKYAEVKRLLGIPEDEPIFIIRAQDKAAWQTLADYAFNAMTEGASPEFCLAVYDDGLNDNEQANNCSAQFRDWQSAHEDRMKIPD